MPAPSAAPAASAAPKPRFFRTQAAFRAWLREHHASSRGLWVGFHRKASGLGGLTYPQALDEALCAGWIDGLRRGIGGESYAIRFSPRKPDSIWSRVNLRKVEALRAQGRMLPAGEKVVATRDPRRTAVYSFENRPRALPPAAKQALAADPKARAGFEAQTPGYQRLCAFWVVSAKKEETRAARLATLIACSAEGKPIPPLRWAKQFRKPRP